MIGVGKLAAVVAAQVLVLAGWVGYHEHLVRTAPTFRLPLRPVDPYDVLRGRYFILNPVDARIDRSRPREGSDLLFDALFALTAESRGFNGKLWIGFCPDAGPAGGVERLCSVRRPEDSVPVPTVPAHEVAAKAHLQLEAEYRVNPDEGPGWPHPETVTGWIDLDLDRFFLPDQTVLPGGQGDPGWEIEVIYRLGQPLLAKRLWFQGKPVEP